MSSHARVAKNKGVAKNKVAVSLSDVPFITDTLPFCKLPLHYIFPFTSNNSVGDVVLSHNLPLLVNLITSFEFHILFPQV